MKKLYLVVLTILMSSSYVVQSIAAGSEQESSHKAQEKKQAEELSDEERYLIGEWVELESRKDKLTAQEVRRLHAIESNPLFKDALEKALPSVDFKGLDDKTCGFCTRLREAYARTAERDCIPNYFD
ncbi:MAG: hypothetical protein Q8Q60_05165 [Candidatus Chromulinivorax sp.]|nr:hypothetical protein [Candidatus Chromulinivorax sp.]